MTLHDVNVADLDFQEGRFLCHDLRLMVRKEPKALFTAGKASVIRETFFSSTGDKITTVAVKEKATKKLLFLDIIHGREEHIDNIFLRTSREFYYGFLATVLKIMPTFVWFFAFY